MTTRYRGRWTEFYPPARTLLFFFCILPGNNLKQRLTTSFCYFQTVNDLQPKEFNQKKKSVFALCVCKRVSCWCATSPSGSSCRVRILTPFTSQILVTSGGPSWMATLRGPINVTTSNLRPRKSMAHCGVQWCSGVNYNRNHLGSAVSICDLILYSRNSLLKPHTATCLHHTHTHTHAAQRRVQCDIKPFLLQ